MIKQHSAYGVWLNRASLGSVGFGFAHTAETTQDGLRVTVEADGPIHVEFADGRTQALAVKRGDVVLGIGGDLYVSLQQTTAPAAPQA